jgi:hypothetical protein
MKPSNPADSLRNLVESLNGNHLATAVAELDRSSRVVRDAMARVETDSAALTKLVNAAMRPSEELRAALKTHDLRMAEMLAQAQESFAKATEALRPPKLPVFNLKLPDSLARTLQELQAYFDALPERTRRELRVWASRGWYLDEEMSVPAQAEVAKSISDGQDDEVDEGLADYFTTRADSILKRVGEKFPHRRVFIAKGLAAHAAGDYELSVPVLLAQADGICKECTSHYLFQGRKQPEAIPKVAVYVEQFAQDTLMAALLSPLAEAHPIVMNEKERTQSFAGLNRHLVLHGEALDYNTRINSAKAISLVAYLCWMLSEAIKDVRPEN